MVAGEGAGPGDLVTDSMAAAGMGDGEYELGGLPVTVVGPVCLSGGVLAGSVLTMEGAVRNLQAMTGADLATAVRAASANPARMCGVMPELALRAGNFANLNRYDADGRRVGATVRGREVPARVAGEGSSGVMADDWWADSAGAVAGVRAVRLSGVDLLGGGGVSGGHYAVWAAVSGVEGPVAARVFSGGADDSVVGDCVVDCVGGDEHADDYQRAGDCVCGRHGVSADCVRVSAGAGGGGAAVFAAVL